MMRPGDGGSQEQVGDEPDLPGEGATEDVGPTGVGGEGAGSGGEDAAVDIGPTGDAGEGTEAASYEAAVERLEQIIERLDSGQAGLRETLELCREGRDLVAYCARELEEVGEGLEELRLDELAEGLERTREPSDSQ